MQQINWHRPFKRRSTEKGSALMMVMAVVALVAIITPIGYSYIHHAVNRQSDRSLRERYMEMVMSLRGELRDPYGCPTLLSGIIMPPTMTADKQVKLNWHYAGSTKPFGAGWSSAEGALKVRDVRLRRTGNAFNTVRIVYGGVDHTLSTIPFRVYVDPANLSINLSDDPSMPTDSPEMVPEQRNKNLMIQLHANVDSTGRIFSCFGANSAAAACEAIGGAFYWAGPVDLRCQPDRICLSGYQGLVKNPDDCQPAGRYPFKARSIGRNLAGQTEYICSLCHDDLLN